MGCDIHVFIEFDRYNDGKWKSVSYDELAFDRCYGVFALMANVRGESELGFYPKGIPKGTSHQTREGIILDVDCHSHSWLTYDELLAVKHAWQLPNHDLDVCLAIMNVHIQHGHCVRIVFAFDN